MVLCAEQATGTFPTSRLPSAARSSPGFTGYLPTALRCGLCSAQDERLSNFFLGQQWQEWTLPEGLACVLAGPLSIVPPEQAHGPGRTEDLLCTMHSSWRTESWNPSVE